MGVSSSRKSDSESVEEESKFPGGPSREDANIEVKYTNNKFDLNRTEENEASEAKDRGDMPFLKNRTDSFAYNLTHPHKSPSATRLLYSFESYRKMVKRMLMARKDTYQVKSAINLARSRGVSCRAIVGKALPAALKANDFPLVELLLEMSSQWDSLFQMTTLVKAKSRMKSLCVQEVFGEFSAPRKGPAPFPDLTSEAGIVDIVSVNKDGSYIPADIYGGKNWLANPQWKLQLDSGVHNVEDATVWITIERVSSTDEVIQPEESELNMRSDFAVYASLNDSTPKGLELPCLFPGFERIDRAPNRFRTAMERHGFKFGQSMTVVLLWESKIQLELFICDPMGEELNLSHRTTKLQNAKARGGVMHTCEENSIDMSNKNDFKESDSSDTQIVVATWDDHLAEGRYSISVKWHSNEETSSEIGNISFKVMLVVRDHLRIFSGLCPNYWRNQRLHIHDFNIVRVGMGKFGETRLVSVNLEPDQSKKRDCCRLYVYA